MKGKTMNDNDYCRREYKRIYDSFLFSMKLFGSHPVYREKLYLNALNKIEQVTKKHLKSGLVSGRFYIFYKQEIDKVHNAMAVV
ncbi:hypothetical protein ACTMS5_01355 [Streptococcus suis]|uniref:hypothetical protein n=1 Tax=Streptococcus suis TaxID=1307 RepID=UPI003F8974C7